MFKVSIVDEKLYSWNELTFFLRIYFSFDVFFVFRRLTGGIGKLSFNGFSFLSLDANVYIYIFSGGGGGDGDGI